MSDDWKPYCYDDKCRVYSKEDKRKPTHGPCCTCQTCGQFYDDCICQYLEDPCKSCSFRDVS
jgi:hypothetical protein